MTARRTNAQDLSYLPFVPPEAPLYPVEECTVCDTADAIALIIACLIVIALVGYGSQSVNGVISAFSVILTFIGIVALACLVYAISSLVYRD